MAENVCAEMVGNVLQVAVELGQRVRAGATLMLLESMKMEIPVLSEQAGTVAEIQVGTGQVVREGDVLVVLV